MEVLLVKLKQIWQKSLIWLLLFWCILSLIYRSRGVVIISGVVIWVIVVFFTAPGVFWNYLSQFIFNQQKKEGWLVKAVSYKPYITQPYTALGLNYARQKRWLETIPLLEQAIGYANPHYSSELKNILAIAYRESGSPDKAVEIITGLIASGANSFIIYLNLASSDMKLGRWEETAVAAEKARSFDVKSNQPVLLMGRAHFELGEFQKAKDDYEWSISHMSWPVESYYWLGRSELALGEKKAAATHLKTALERIKDDPDMSDVPYSKVEEWLKQAEE
jgi:tetratricopeptide (TPR) repeat protein